MRLNHDEGNREERPGRFLTTRAPIGQHVKMFRQVKAPPSHDSSEFRFRTHFQVSVLARRYNVGSGRSGPNAIRVNGDRGTKTDRDEPITIVFAGINDHIHSRGFLSRLRQPTTAESTVWPAIQDILESMGEVVGTLKEGSFTKMSPRAVFALFPEYARLPDGLKFVYANVALLSEGKYDVIISAPNREIEMENLRPLRTELPVVWSDISNAMRGFTDHALCMLVLDEMLGLELSNFSRQLKLKPGVSDDHQVIVAMSDDLWFRGMDVTGERERRKNSQETRAHLEAMVLRTKPEANQCLI